VNVRWSDAMLNNLAVIVAHSRGGDQIADVR
jgi:hypothetical protein